MKKKFIIVLVIQSIFILLMLMYAFVQKAEADKHPKRAEDQRIQAEQNAAIAVKLQMKLDSIKQITSGKTKDQNWYSFIGPAFCNLRETC